MKKIYFYSILLVLAFAFAGSYAAEVEKTTRSERVGDRVV